MWLPRIAVALAIAAGTALFFLPLLNRVPAADQISYLAELEGDRSLAAGLRLLDYGRERRFNRGDELLYRPLLLAVLAVENTLFGPSHRAWNALNVAMHSLTAAALFLWLEKRLSRTVAVVLSLCFALAPATVELVAWPHLLGYLLAGLSWLGALHALDHVERAPRAAWLAFSLAALCGVFLYEISLVATMALGVWGLWRAKGVAGRWRRLGAALVLLPLLLYGLAYLTRLPSQQRLLYVDEHGGEPLPLPLRTLSVGAAFLGQSLVPGLFGREVAAYRRTLTYPLADAPVPGALLLIAFLAVAVAAGSSRARLSTAWPLLLALGAIAGAHLSAVALGRDLGSVWISGYHVYLFHLLLVLALALVVEPERSRQGARGRLLLGGLGVWLVSLVAVSVPLLWDYHRENAAPDAYLEQLRDTGRRFPDRRLELAALSMQVDPPRPLVEGYPGPGSRGFRVPPSHVILPDLFRREGEPLRVLWTGDRLVIVPEPPPGAGVR